MIQRILRNKMILAIVSVVAGIFLILARGRVLVTLIRVLGYGLIGAAIAYFLLYFSGRNGKDEIALGYGVLAGAAGLLVVWLAPSIVNLFPVLMGLGLMISGITSLLGAGSGRNKIGPVVVIILGALILFHPGAILNAVVLCAGIALVVNGLSDLNLIRGWLR